ncbi:hypothetical protein PMKS-002075 [Pichia membranifaciens]|uniref:Uncharacterized protein n=1 Tax=Pichia membranifaciens TaxID=4926 RepID=A0A1Q2YGU0_9ASCO|nr:hypothetical protein PMKS-002075 [Pichia membranifaciens]
MDGIYSRNRKPLSFGTSSSKGFNLLDDFQNGDINETIDLFPAPSLNPPQNSSNHILNNNNSLSKDINKNDRDFFDLGSSASSDGNFSIFSMMPATGSSTPAFDFNSYLLSVTSNLQITPKMASKGVQSTNLLDLSKPLKLDVLQEKDRSVISEKNIMDDLELDCVVRSSVWDSDTETEDELELHLNLDNEKETEEGKNEASDNAIDNSLRNDYDIANDDYLKYFNQSMTSNSSETQSSYNQPLRSMQQNKSFVSPKFSISNDISSMAKPVEIFSDPQPKLKSPISSQGSDETLHDEEEQLTALKYGSNSVNHQKRTITFSQQNDLQLDLGVTSHKQLADSKKCSPHHHIFAENLRSALKPIPKALLNLIVESSDGSLEDATKYATEINAQNSEGIPIPEKTTELVNIPTTAPSVNGVRKSAIVRGVRARTGCKKKVKKSQGGKPETLIADVSKWNKDNHQNADKLVERQESIIQANENRQNIISNINNNFRGFYSLQEKQQFTKRNIATGVNENQYNEDKENIDAGPNEKGPNYKVTGNLTAGFKRAKVVKTEYRTINTNGKKRVNWAESLEW